MSPHALIEAILFYRAEPILRSELGRILDLSPEGVDAGVNMLRESLDGRGVCLIEDGESVALATAAETASAIEKLRMDELSHEIGKAGLETLSIVLYRAPVSRSTIDYIRGVNSQSIVRSLSIRGLIEKAAATKSRGALYKPTVELLAHLGVRSVEDLPNYREMRKELSLAEEVVAG